MHRLRYGDWIVGLGALALLALLLIDGDDGWGEVGWLTAALAALAIAAGCATPLLTITRRSPSAPLLTSVIALVVGTAAAVALFADGAGIAVVAALAVVVGASLSIHDERAPGAPEIAVERRPAPQ